METSKALNLQAEIEALCKKHGLWVAIEHEKKPDLKIIRIKEISIKVDKQNS